MTHTLLGRFSFLTPRGILLISLLDGDDDADDDELHTMIDIDAGCC